MNSEEKAEELGHSCTTICTFNVYPIWKKKCLQTGKFNGRTKSTEKQQHTSLQFFPNKMTDHVRMPVAVFLSYRASELRRLRRWSLKTAGSWVTKSITQQFCTWNQSRNDGARAREGARERLKPEKTFKMCNEFDWETHLQLYKDECLPRKKGKHMLTESVLGRLWACSFTDFGHASTLRIK